MIPNLYERTRAVVRAEQQRRLMALADDVIAHTAGCPYASSPVVICLRCHGQSVRGRMRHFQTGKTLQRRGSSGAPVVGAYSGRI